MKGYKKMSWLEWRVITAKKIYTKESLMYHRFKTVVSFAAFVTAAWPFQHVLN
jgi:hypothetical protein